MTQTEFPHTQLLQNLLECFNEKELRTLCFDACVDYDSLPAQGKAGKARELILALARAGRLDELIERCRVLRPRIAWQAVDGADVRPRTAEAVTTNAQALLEFAIRIKKATDAEDAPLRVSAEVKQLGLDAGPFDFAVPLDDKVLDELHWYLELYPHWPVGPDYDRALGIEAKLREWGKRLFDAVFNHREMMRVYEQFRLKAESGGLITLDSTDARILRLPWELLADEGGYLYTQPAHRLAAEIAARQSRQDAALCAARPHPDGGEPPG